MPLAVDPTEVKDDSQKVDPMECARYSEALVSFLIVVDSSRLL